LTFSDSVRARLWDRIGCAIGGLACLSVCCAANRFFHPHDEVMTTISGIPVDTDFLCLVVDKHSGPEVMLWSLRKLGSFTMHPDSCTVSFLDKGVRSHRAPVRWVSSVRVGVLRRTTGGKWYLSWYGSPKLKLEGRSFLFGGGLWEADFCNSDEVQPVLDDQLRAMGMDYSLQGKR
jgi:hypothetical protein